MCGIVGLLLKKPELRDQLGELMTPMLVGMTSRGPDSAGVAIFGNASADLHKLSLFWGEGAADWKRLAAELSAEFDGKHRAAHKFRESGQHAVLTTPSDPDAVKAWLGEAAPEIYVLSMGRSIDLYKDIGAPAEIVRRYALDKVQGTHVVAHTRMATESAVTPAHAHPFTAGQDFCLVHNGSLSNPHLVRKKLEPLFRARRLFHVHHGNRQGNADRARCLRLQARGGGRDGRLRRHRLGIPLARASSRHPPSPALRTNT